MNLWISCFYRETKVHYFPQNGRRLIAEYIQMKFVVCIMGDKHWLAIYLLWKLLLITSPLSKSKTNMDGLKTLIYLGSLREKVCLKHLFSSMIIRSPPSLNELTSMVFDTGLTHLGSEVSLIVVFSFSKWVTIELKS